MPIYGYTCAETGAYKEYNVRLAAIERKPSLLHGFVEFDINNNLTHWKRVYHPPAIQFKGSGWAGKS